MPVAYYIVASEMKIRDFVLARDTDGLWFSIAIPSGFGVLFFFFLLHKSAASSSLQINFLS